MALRLTILFLILSNCCFAQNGNIIPFKNDSSIADKNGVAKDSTTFYFPANEFRDTIHFVIHLDSTVEWNNNNWYWNKIGKDCKAKSLLEYAEYEKTSVDRLRDSIYSSVDSFKLEWFSSILFKMDEPLLYNNNLSDDIFRFTYLPSFSEPTIIRIVRSNDSVKMIVKQLSRDLQPPAILVRDSTGEKDSLVIPDNNIPLILNETRRLSEKEVLRLKRLIKREKILYQPHILRKGCKFLNDGEIWIFEMQTKDGYYFMERHSPEFEGWDDKSNRDGMVKLGKLMVELNGLDVFKAEN